MRAKIVETFKVLRKIDVWKLFVIMCSLILIGCEEHKSQPLDTVENKNISINFYVDYKLLSSTDAHFFIVLNLNDEHGDHIELGPDDEMRAYLNHTEYLLQPFYCSSMYGEFLCRYIIPDIKYEVTNLVQPVTISLEIRRNKGELITTTATLPSFFTMNSSISPEKKYDPLSDVLQVTWMSTVPVKQIKYFADKNGNYRSCSGTILKTPQASDTYVRYNANELGLDANLCRPMSYASVAVETMESVTAMQTNVPLAVANIRLNQEVQLNLLNEPYVGAE
jgi:hypothetical protein